MLNVVSITLIICNSFWVSFFIYSQSFKYLFIFKMCLFLTYLSIFASISSVIVARPTTPPIVHVPPESDSHELAQTQISRESRDSLSVNSAVLVYAKFSFGYLMRKVLLNVIKCFFSTIMIMFGVWVSQQWMTASWTGIYVVMESVWTHRMVTCATVTLDINHMHKERVVWVSTYM